MQSNLSRLTAGPLKTADRSHLRRSLCRESVNGSATGTNFTVASYNSVDSGGGGGTQCALFL